MWNLIKYLTLVYKFFGRVGFNARQIVAIFGICIVTCAIAFYAFYYIIYLVNISEAVNQAPQSQQDYIARTKIDDLVLDRYVPDCGASFYWSISRIYTNYEEGEYLYTLQVQKLYGYKRLPNFLPSGTAQNLLQTREPFTKRYMSMYKNPALINENSMDKMGRIRDDEMIKLSSKTVIDWDIEPLKTFMKKRNEVFDEDVYDYSVLAVIRDPYAEKINKAPKFIPVKKRFPIIIVVAVSKLKKEKAGCNNDILLSYLAEMTNIMRTGSFSSLHEINSFKLIDTTDQTQRDNFLQRI